MDLETQKYSLINGDFVVTTEIKKSFEENGFIIVKNLLSVNEIHKLVSCIDENEWIHESVTERGDDDNRKVRMTLWNKTGDDITGMIARCHKVAGTMEELLGGEVYHYHTKLILKEAFTGGSFVWHQDYGYWYENGCLTPDMGTVFIAIDECTKENGCLKIIPKSHLCGRIRHKLVGEQVGADLERVEHIISRMGPVVDVVLEPGDALFFHSNLLHTSAANSSAQRRWAHVVAYNRADNDPVIEHHLPKYIPLHRVENSSILASETFINQEDKDVLTSSKDAINIQKINEKRECLNKK